MAKNEFCFAGNNGALSINDNDEISKKLAMLIEVKCRGKKVTDVVKKYGYTRQRFYQILETYQNKGALGLKNKKRGPKENSKRKQSVISQIIRYRFLDPKASAEVIVQKLKQTGLEVSRRSVERTITEYGLQKKTLYQMMKRNNQQK